MHVSLRRSYWGGRRREGSWCSLSLSSSSSPNSRQNDEGRIRFSSILNEATVRTSREASILYGCLYTSLTHLQRYTNVNVSGCSPGSTCKMCFCIGCLRSSIYNVAADESSLPRHNGSRTRTQVSIRPWEMIMNNQDFQQLFIEHSFTVQFLAGT